MVTGPVMELGDRSDPDPATTADVVPVNAKTDKVASGTLAHRLEILPSIASPGMGHRSTVPLAWASACGAALLAGLSAETPLFAAR